MATFPAKTNYAAGNVLTAAQMVDIGDQINAAGYNIISQPVINSGLDIWQRGTSFTTTAGYTADRWYFDSAAGRTVSRQTTSDTTNLPSIQYCARIQRNSGNTSTADMLFSQSFETVNSIPFAGKTVTLSFYARRGANFSSTNNILTAYLLSGTGTDQNQRSGYTGQATVISANSTLTTTWQRFSYTGTIAATATELAIVTFYSPTGTAGTNDYFEITGVQLDVGATALPYRKSSSTLGMELAACQRYYFRQTSNSTNGAAVPLATGIAGSTTSLSAIMNYPVTMRSVPTSVDFALVNSWQGGGLTAISNVTLASNSVGTDKAILTCTTTGLTTGQSYGVLTNASGVAGFIGLSAEL